MKSHGFTLIKEQEFNEVGGTARFWKHDASGAELLSITNGDENKSFGVAFRTPPKDSTGVAHILEHSVLCGSKKYPVKEPFVELLKSSLQTFLNALTFPDKTCYPVASTNLQDFYNLIDVYVDAVFYPRIDEDVLRQEGWHIDVNPEGEWYYKGVVFNEMKGVYSSPDSVLMEQSQQVVFPDTLYSLDSGGNPENILDLTYEEFRNFHSQYYHPSNARFFFWGDDPEEARLEKLEAVLAPFTAQPVDSQIPLQPLCGERRMLTVPYEAGQDAAEAGERQSHLTCSWLLCESKEVEELLVLEMLEHILIGLPGSPLRKALMDSGLGEDLTGAGLETDLRQAYFSIGMRSIRPEDAPALEALIQETLENLVREGIPAQAIAAAVNSIEFELRENNTGRFPRGLVAMFRSLTTWLYDGDPFTPLAWEAPLASIKHRLAAGEAMFENAIRAWLLDNPHEATVLLVPDATLAATRQEKENTRLEAARGAMDEKERAEVASIAQRLHLAQETPDEPEALATIPSLGLEDLPQQNTILPCHDHGDGEPRYLTQEIDTTGILYARFLFPLDAVPVKLLPLVPLYARALTELGTQRRDYVELGLELAAHTGSLDAYFALHTNLDTTAPMPFLEVAGKATADRVGKLADLMQEILLEPRFDVPERFMQMVMEEKARLEQSIIPAGHALVSLRLNGQLSLTGWLSELTHGVHYLESIRGLASDIMDQWPAILADLQELHRLIVRKNLALCSLTGDASLLGQALPIFQKTGASLPSEQALRGAWGIPDHPGPEALVTPAQVNYVGLGMDLSNTGYIFHGSASVIMRHLRMGYLWDRVRVQGGAYGIFANMSRATGNFVFLSYRDPNVERTLEVYRQAADYLGNLRMSQEDVTKAIVGAIGDMDAYLLPGAKGSTALWRALTRDTPQLRQQIREEILGTTLQDFHNFAPFLANALPSAIPCVLGGQAAETVAQAQGWAINSIL